MDPFSRELNELLVSTYREITRIEELVLRGLSKNTLSISELHMLDVVGSKGCTVTDIAQSMGISMPSATIAVKKLEKKGYVTKEKDANDARKVVIRLTIEGRKAEAAHRWFHRQMVHNVEKAVPPQDQKALLYAIRELNVFFMKKAHELGELYQLDGAEGEAE
jgi:DNA-binding MarR family transcriptional regulator